MGARPLRLPAALILLGLVIVGPAVSRAGPEGSVSSGKRLYLDGTGSSGQPLEATTLGDVAVRGSQLSCAGCHRRSGYGSSEGGNYVPPITAPVLYQPRQADRAKLFKKLFMETQPPEFASRVRSPRMRPAYTDETLARAVRDGVDAQGRELDPLMPRYRLGDTDMANLTAYLKTLSTAPDPGVDDTGIRFATVIAGDVDPGRRDAMLAVLRSFFEWINLDTLGDLANPNFSPNYRTDFVKAYRTWSLDVWELSGAPGTWPAQLAAAYDARPVFALVSGLVEGPWAPVQGLCEARRLPCLFPHTELPGGPGENIYSVHFSRGLELEADVIGRFISRDDGLQKQARLVQIYDTGPGGARPARALAAALEAGAGYRLEQHAVGDGLSWPEAIARSASEGQAADVLILWPGARSVAALDALAADPSVARRIFLPSAALEAARATAPPKLRERLYLAYPYEVPGAYHPRAFRVRAWMGSRGLAITHRRIQFDTFFALTMLQYGLEHIVDDFSRDYLLEYVEHEAENALNPGTYPRLSLGPGQRYASKGAYIVKLDAGARGGFGPVGDWIVP